MRTHVRFRTGLFRPHGPTDDQFENGRELAEWLAKGLRIAGYDGVDCFAEDWGWMVVFGRSVPVWLGCSSAEDDQWLVFCEMHRTFFDRLLRRPAPVEQQERLVQAVASLIQQEPQFREFDWFESDSRGREFNHGQSAT